MTLQIGRVGLDISFDNPNTFATDSGRKVTMTGEYVATSLAAAQALRQQLLGTFGGAEGPPEPVIPVVWSEDDSVAGYYRPIRCTVENKELSLVDFAFRFSCELERIPAYQSPTISSRSIGWERSGAGGVSEDYYLAYPADAKWTELSNADTGNYYVRPGPGGSSRLYVDPSLASSVSLARIDPADFHDNRPYIKVNGYEVVGPDVPAIGNGDDWELGNGHIKLQGAAGSYTFRLTGPLGATPTSWGTAYAFKAGAYLSGSRKTLRPDHVEVVDLGFDRAAICLTGGIQTAGSTDQYRVKLILAVRRGMYHVEGVIQTNLSCQAFLEDNAGASLTVVTAGKTLRSTANDADGNRIWIASGTTLNTTSAGSGLVYANVSGRTLPFGLGVEINGSSAATPDKYDEQIDNYWAEQVVAVQVG